MPVPTSLTDLSTTPASNYPAGSDAPSTIDDTLRAHAALMATLRDRWSAFGLTLTDDATAGDALTTLGLSAFIKTLVDDVDASAARATLGTDVYKSVPGNAALTAGEMYKATAGFTLNTGASEGMVYPVYNNSAAAITITQGSGLTLRLAGTTSTGNRTIAARGMASVWCLSTTEYIISGAGVS